ncbi:classical arabinogalactan protein 5-like [Diospyros lotus]|uniref:classical arabinogalactan protein 5-like n=1 Tax=Diospyros lotus TaxID=55363 RepID=UPI00224D4496|nr:classical arabinogalactan protein 5-like [Diospyros lotus]
MEVEPSPQEIAKKLWSIARVVFFMLRKGVSKSKLMVDLYMLLKRGKLAGKALGNLMLHHHYAAMTCRSNDVHLSFVSPASTSSAATTAPSIPPTTTPPPPPTATSTTTATSTSTTPGAATPLMTTTSKSSRRF